jgi:hypothetical protein
MLPIFRSCALRVIALAFLAVTLLLSQTSPLFAQSPQPVSSGIATMVDIKENVTQGDIISFTANGYKKSVMAYDPQVFGVITETPQVVLENSLSKNSHPVISMGKVYVKVRTTNGPIKAGDLITTSKVAGVGQKANESGYVLGTAVENYTASDPNETGTIIVILSLGFNTRATTVSSNLIQNLKLALAAPEVSPVNALRYVLAALIVLIGFIFGVGFFGRVSASGVEAIGRNPLASRLILFSMIFHLTLSLVIILVGIAIAYLILVL